MPYVMMTMKQRKASTGLSEGAHKILTLVVMKNTLVGSRNIQQTVA
jgi:hypothetical protein